MRIQFRPDGLEDGEANIYRVENNAKIGSLVWTTGAEDGWYFKAHPVVGAPDFVRVGNIEAGPTSARTRCVAYLEKRFGCDISVEPFLQEMEESQQGEALFAAGVEGALVCSWREIGFEYDKLTDVEQRYVSREQHAVMINWLRDRSAIHWTEVGTNDGQKVMGWDVVEHETCAREKASPYHDGAHVWLVPSGGNGDRVYLAQYRSDTTPTAVRGFAVYLTDVQCRAHGPDVGFGFVVTSLEEATQEAKKLKELWEGWTKSGEKSGEKFLRHLVGPDVDLNRYLQAMLHYEGADLCCDVTGQTMTLSGDDDTTWEPYP